MQKRQTMQPAEIITANSYSLSVRNAQKQSCKIIDSSLCSVIPNSCLNKIHWICPSDAMKQEKETTPYTWQVLFTNLQNKCGWWEMHTSRWKWKVWHGKAWYCSCEASLAVHTWQNIFRPGVWNTVQRLGGVRESTRALPGLAKLTGHVREMFSDNRGAVSAMCSRQLKALVCRL